ncbi:DUF5959 family protein [Streptomyces sp. NBC_00691]|uniref:DUF5959 family protein n=1 Tax=Streptomyces sp. NBC_00691 TaxID=2903671 RepID=UPI002E344E48|nr:DUF5959 family protein [Streptomyces sp. NBC_00691]
MLPFDLIQLTDEENEVKVTVLEPMESGMWEAEIRITSLFVTGTTLLVLHSSKLEAWAQALDSLTEGRDITWMSDNNGPTMTIELDGDRGCPDILVEDESISMVTVRVPIALEGDWINDHRERLRQFIQGSPGPS